MAGKRLTVRSRDIRWREGRYGKRRRRRPQTRPLKSRPILDSLIAIGVSLFAGGVVFCMAFVLLGAHKVPLHLGYAAILGGVIACCLLFGHRDRAALMILGGLVAVWVLGTAGLYASRDQIVLRPHQHHSSDADHAR
ncbi:hypothetical protein [Brevundimonas nasdae]|uniref:Uncharacterized protein n=1 Tax=Brevundimonas nasdae TaxID=172043 RepID=A0ACD4VPC9_9CAUL|nr:hypothetical protein [Brevundimonas nasdae]WOB79915.1 hypothetical protein PZA08_07005 [Brevundimonas nasdae]